MGSSCSAGGSTDHLGRRRIFVSGLAVFTAASFVAGAAQGAGLLIAARAVQGFGAALVAPAALSLLAVTFAEGRERDRAFGIFGAVGGVAGSVGVVASGLLTAGPGWRWAFFINLPVGTLAIVLSLAFLAADRPHDRDTRLDLSGATTVTGGLLLLVYALHHAANHGLVSGSALALFAAAAVLLAAFVRIEARSEAPLVPAAILRNRSVVAANLAAFLAFAALLSFIFIGSLLMQQALGYSPTKTGLAWLTTTMTVFAAAMVGARLAARVQVRWLLITGLSAVTAGTLWLTRVPAEASYVGRSAARVPARRDRFRPLWARPPDRRPVRRRPGRDRPGVRPRGDDARGRRGRRGGRGLDGAGGRVRPGRLPHGLRVHRRPGRPGRGGRSCGLRPRASGAEHVRVDA